MYVVPKSLKVPLVSGGAVPAELASSAVASLEQEQARPAGLAPGGPIPGGPGAPSIELISSPGIGSSADIRGRTLHVDPAEYVIAAVIRVNGGWWTKPYFATPSVPLNASGEFKVDVTTGGVDPQADRILLYLRGRSRSTCHWFRRVAAREPGCKRAKKCPVDMAGVEAGGRSRWPPPCRGLLGGRARRLRALER